MGNAAKPPAESTGDGPAAPSQRNDEHAAHGHEGRDPKDAPGRCLPRHCPRHRCPPQRRCASAPSGCSLGAGRGGGGAQGVGRGRPRRGPNAVDLWRCALGACVVPPGNRTGQRSGPGRRFSNGGVRCRAENCVKHSAPAPSGRPGGWFGLASTRPLVSGITLTAHARPKAWECGSVTPSLSCTSACLADRLCRALSAGCRPVHVSVKKNCTMVAHWQNSTSCIAAGTCTWSAGTNVYSCVPSPSAAMRVRDRGTPLMMRSNTPPHVASMADPLFGGPSSTWACGTGICTASVGGGGYFLGGGGGVWILDLVWGPILRLTGHLGWSRMASPTTLHIGWPCHVRCTPQALDGPFPAPWGGGGLGGSQEGQSGEGGAAGGVGGG